MNCQACGHRKGAHQKDGCHQLGCRCGRYEPSRQEILDNFRSLRKDVEQMFIDCDHWNRYVRLPHEDVMDPDPGGRLRRLVRAIDEMLATDPGTGPIAPLRFQFVERPH